MISVPSNCKCPNKHIWENIVIDSMYLSTMFCHCLVCDTIFQYEIDESKGDDMSKRKVQWFTDSPDTGEMTCICSWCEMVISDEDVPAIRMTTNTKLPIEARFHVDCWSKNMPEIQKQVAEKDLVNSDDIIKIYTRGYDILSEYKFQSMNYPTKSGAYWFYGDPFAQDSRNATYYRIYHVDVYIGANGRPIYIAEGNFFVNKFPGLWVKALMPMI